jgi:GNAT superfamily N-acetyltransferase
LDDFALFVALKEHFGGRPWSAWPEEFKRRDPAAIKGRWTPGPRDDFLKRLAQDAIIAEDLGDIDETVVEALRRFGFPGMKVLLFAFGGDKASMEHNPHSLRNHTENSIVYTGTHDNNTVKGWFAHEATQQERENLAGFLARQGRGPATSDNVHWMLINAAMESVSRIAIIAMQDLLGLGQESRMNKPGTIDGNWQWRMRAGAIDRALIQRFRQLTVDAGRARPVTASSPLNGVKIATYAQLSELERHVIAPDLITWARLTGEYDFGGRMVKPDIGYFKKNILLAIENGRLRGFLKYQILKDQAQVVYIHVHDDHLGRGIGRSLFETFQRYAFVEFKKPLITSTEILSSALGFWQKVAGEENIEMAPGYVLYGNMYRSASMGWRLFIQNLHDVSPIVITGFVVQDQLLADIALWQQEASSPEFLLQPYFWKIVMTLKGATYRADYKGKPAAYAHVVPSSDKKALIIKAFVVRPAMRAAGIGPAVMRRIMVDYPRQRLIADPGSPQAERLYHRLGFERLDNGLFVYTPQGFNASSPLKIIYRYHVIPKSVERVIQGILIRNDGRYKQAQVSLISTGNKLLDRFLSDIQSQQHSRAPFGEPSLDKWWLALTAPAGLKDAAVWLAQREARRTGKDQARCWRAQSNAARFRGRARTIRRPVARRRRNCR